MVRSTPCCSMASVVARIPAVSINRNWMPLMFITSSMVSRVVPGISETMARSSFSKAFNRVDLPALGLPAITVFTPFLITLPSLNDSANGCSNSCIRSINAISCSRLANSTSSSLKSSSSSISEAKFKSCVRRSFIWLLKPPRICCKASCCDADEEEAIKSATASACERSIRPCIKARRVNSPGLAERAPFCINSRIICSATKGEPWQDISITSSVVKLLGALKRLTITSSKILSPSKICP